MLKFQPGDYVKAEFTDEVTGESEWMWVQVDSCDDETGLLFRKARHRAQEGVGLREAVSHHEKET